jgi:hypothetical protein
VSSLNNDGIQALMGSVERDALTMKFSLVRKDVADLIKGDVWKTQIAELYTKRALQHPILTTDQFNDWMKTLLADQSNSSLDQIRSQLHDFGYILDFSQQFNLVIVDPQWLMNAFKSIFSFK